MGWRARRPTSSAATAPTQNDASWSGLIVPRSAATRTRNAARSSPWPWVPRAPASAVSMSSARGSSAGKLAAIDVWRATDWISSPARVVWLRVIRPCPSTSTSFECEPGQTKTRPSWPGSSRPPRVSSARAPRVPHSSPRMTSARIQPSGPASAGVRNPGTKWIGRGQIFGGPSVQRDHPGPGPDDRRLAPGRAHVSCFSLAFGCGESDVDGTRVVTIGQNGQHRDPG